MKRKISLIVMSISFLVILSNCSTTLPWPESPLYNIPVSDSQWEQPRDVNAAIKLITGHYAHYDVVSYEDTNTRAPMRTFIITYGFTDFFVKDGKLYQIDKFYHAEQILNQKNVKSIFKDESVQAIKPRVQEVQLDYVDGQWQIFRPASPTLLGIKGDPDLPLSRDKSDTNLTDPDGDGNPGVTVELQIGSFIKGYIYITRREIYENHLTLHSSGNLYGYIKDSSEQFVVGATMKVLRQQSNPYQIPDPAMNPIMLIRVSDEIDTYEELMENRDRLFPAEPRFY